MALEWQRAQWYAYIAPSTGEKGNRNVGREGALGGEVAGHWAVATHLEKKTKGGI